MLAGAYVTWAGAGIAGMSFHMLHVTDRRLSAPVGFSDEIPGFIEPADSLFAAFLQTNPVTIMSKFLLIVGLLLMAGGIIL